MKNIPLVHHIFYHQLELYETCLSDVCQLCMLSNLIVRKCAQKAIIGILNNLQSTYRIVNRRCHEEKREKTTHLIIVQNLFSPSVLFANFLSLKCYSLRKFNSFVEKAITHSKNDLS